MKSEDLDIQHKLMKDRGICVIIPTYNNMGTIADVVMRAKQQCQDVIVVCDGCTDGTLKIVQEIDDIVLVCHRKNKGKGSALKSGFRKALELGFSYAITLDADGQHFPEDIPFLVDANVLNPGAIIVGERKNLDKVERSAGSKFANKFSNFWFFVQTGCRLKDTQTGYRLYPLKKMVGLRFLTSRYEAELELLVFAVWHGVDIVSIPVNVYYPTKEERVSYFRPAMDFTRISILNTILCCLVIIYAIPLAIFRKVRQVAVTIYGVSFFMIMSFFVLTPMTMIYTMIYTMIGGLTERKRKHIRLLLHWFARFIMVWHGIPRVGFRCNNPTNETFRNPAIIICNHQSHLDLMILLSQMDNIVFMTNNWVWNSPLFGYVIRKAGYILSSSGVENVEEQVKYQIEQGVNVAIFPEGTRSKDCSIKRFHSGAFYLASSIGVDIIPLVIYGAGKVLPKKGKLLRKWKIELYVGSRILNKELKMKSTTMREVASHMRKYYKERYSEIKNRVEQNV